MDVKHEVSRRRFVGGITTLLGYLTLRPSGVLLSQGATPRPRIGVDEYDVVWQSRSGPPQVPWLAPDILDHLDALHATGTAAVVVAPVGFVSDHVEVVWDLDTEGRERARFLIDALHARLKARAAARPRFHVVDMRAALPDDNTHWADEIHPSGTGFRKLAEDHWRPLVRTQVPGRGFE